MKLSSYPRLYIGPKELARLQQQPASPFLKAAHAWVATNSADWVQMPPLTFKPDTHNSFLIRAREVQTRVLTLLTRWRQTNDIRYRDAAIDYIRMLGDWKCWSWITWRQGDYRPTAIYDLSYGENSATLAMAYDLLHATLSPAEKRLFMDIATKWPFASGTVHCRPHAAWWFAEADSNWNTVCAGGLGMLCLAMYDDLPQARQLLPRVEKSFVPYMRHLDKTSGAWPEGIGYWNYGMYYAFMYLLSWERSTGRRHPLLQLQGVRKTLEFPLDFTPNGRPCSFGDGNNWTPLPFHYAMARRLRVHSVLQRIDAILQQDPHNACRGDWASAAGWLLFHDDRYHAVSQTNPRVAKLYQGLDWAILADQHPKPQLFMSIRGGTTNIPHGHCDLFSFHVVVNDEKLITNEGNAEYLDTTFSPRRYDLPDINAQFKNTILINGVGIPHGAALDSTRIFNRPGVSGVRLEGTGAMNLARGNENAATFCGRLALLLKGKAFLIIDRVVTSHPARIETRLHTHARVRAQPRGAYLCGKREKLRLAFASNVPGLLALATTAPTTPTAEPAGMLRWCTRALHRDMVHATLAVPGAAPAAVSVKQTAKFLTITVRARLLTMQLTVSDDLNVLHVK
jgi:hypothetical protein